MANDHPMCKPDLDEALHRGCQDPDCVGMHEHEGIFLTPRCHPGVGVDVGYTDGVLYLVCHRCKEDIVQVAVAESLPPW